MENRKKEKALELWTDSKTCEYIKKNGLEKCLNAYLSRILINLVECININDPSFETRITLIRLLSSKNADGEISFEANWSDELGKAEDFNKWINDLGDSYDKTN